MEKIRLRDIADALGLSVATVSNVLNGRNNRVSEATRIRVLEAIEKSGYLPERAEVLLARNPSRMIGLAVNDHPEYEGDPLEDPYMARFISCLQKAASKAGSELLVRPVTSWEEASRFASMWNMAGLVVTGFCDADYRALKNTLKIPLSACDASGSVDGISQTGTDDFSGGRIAGAYLRSLGHERVLIFTTNLESCDLARIRGLQEEVSETETVLISHVRSERLQQFEDQDFTGFSAVFCVSDKHALELLSVLYRRHIPVPDQLSVIGFDGIEAGRNACPPLTTVSQDLAEKARLAVLGLQKPGIYQAGVNLTVRESCTHAKDVL